MAYENATPGTTLTGPLEVVAPEGEDDFEPLYLPSEVSEDSAVQELQDIVAALVERLR